MHLAVALWEAFLTCSTPLKPLASVTSSLFQNNTLALAFFSSCFQAILSACEIVDMNHHSSTFDPTAFTEWECERTVISSETSGLHWAIWASVILLIWGFQKATDHRNLRPSLANKHINTHPLIRVKKSTKLVTAGKRKKEYSNVSFLHLFYSCFFVTWPVNYRKETAEIRINQSKSNSMRSLHVT